MIDFTTHTGILIRNTARSSSSSSSSSSFTVEMEEVNDIETTPKSVANSSQPTPSPAGMNHFLNTIVLTFLTVRGCFESF